MALESVKQGLDALKKAYGLSDEQFEALVNFAGAEAILKKEPASKVSIPAKVETAHVAEPTADKAAAEAKAAAEKKAKEEAAAKAQAEAEAKVKAEAKAAAEKKAKEEAAAKAQAEKKAKAEATAKADTDTARAAVGQKKQEAPKKKAKPAPAGLAAPELAVESVPFADRAAKVPASSYKVNYSGSIRETKLGNGDNIVTVGGSSVLPFHLFEGDMPRKPLIAMEIQDIKPDNWPATLTQYFDDVLDNPAAWAKKCVNEYNADALNIYLVGTDPNGMNRKASEAAKDAAAVIDAVDVPIIVWGCGNNEKDTETLREITSIIGDKKVCLAPLEDANYRAVGATAMAFQHPMVAASPIDVNLAKQLNILLENLGVPLDTVMMDPSIGALGYGIEYTYSVMERIRIAALTQKDEKLQVPIICNLGREVWKTKEVGLPTDETLGDQERRGIMMEAITASCMLLAGGEVLIMRHPKAINMTKSLIKGLMA
ncbi:MAG: acetyl-CoA decarbonylase/synthase complex subunit delta [Desulfobulbaceae bacterium]|nr:acetyl-CoA decarbonylase/synthase complex subunit delta [Desulfobulbaceae bacterium]